VSRNHGEVLEVLLRKKESNRKLRISYGNRDDIVLISPGGTHAKFLPYQDWNWMQPLHSPARFLMLPE